jgi:hypothetical protein
MNGDGDATRGAGFTIRSAQNLKGNALLHIIVDINARPRSSGRVMGD